MRDLHVHTLFSSDSRTPMEAHVLRALALGLETVCFTDHVDYNPADYGYLFYQSDAFFAELEALPEVEGSILYTMELQSMISSLKSLMLIVEDKRLDDASVAEEIKKVIVKVEPAGEPQGEEASAEEQAIEKAKSITFNACIRALDSLGI